MMFHDVVISHHNYDIMARFIDYNDQQTWYGQTLVDGSAERCKKAIFNDSISMAALMAAFRFRTWNFDFLEKKPPLKPPLICCHRKWIFCSDISLDLRGFDNIQNISVCRQIFLSEIRYFSAKMVGNHYYFEESPMKAIFWSKYWRYGLEVPRDENFLLGQRLWLWHFRWCIFKNGGFNGGFLNPTKCCSVSNVVRNTKAAIKAAILEDTSSEMSQP